MCPHLPLLSSPRVALTCFSLCWGRMADCCRRRVRRMLERDAYRGHCIRRTVLAPADFGAFHYRKFHMWVRMMSGIGVSRGCRFMAMVVLSLTASFATAQGSRATD